MSASHRGTRIAAGVGVLVLLVVLGAIPRVRRARALDAAAVSDSTNALAVSVVTARRGKGNAELELTGTVDAVHQTAIYARANGYVRRWYVDIGGRVKEGQLLAEIETPELDHEIAQARADRARARSALALSERTVARWEALAKENAVPVQELDERRAATDDARQSVEAAEQNVKRLEALHSFAQLAAPFNGVITSRNLEVGTLVSAGPPSNTAAPGAPARLGGLYTIAQTDTIRLLVNVPQSYVSSISTGLPADVTVTEIRDRRFQGRVEYTSRALDANTRTLLVDVRVPNRDGALLPGMYAQVHFRLERGAPPIVVPASVLVVRPDSPQVAIVGPDSVVHYRSVVLGRDFGGTVEILDGLDDGTVLIASPSDNIVEGARVHVVAPPANADH